MLFLNTEGLVDGSLLQSNDEVYLFKIFKLLNIKACLYIFCILAHHLIILDKSTIKGTHTIYFTISFYIIYQKPMIPETDLHCETTWVARFSV